MLVHKGGKIKNWVGECRDVTPTKLQSQNIFKESTGGRVGGGVRMDVKIKKKNNGGGIGSGGGGGGIGGQGRCEQRSAVFVKIQKQKYLFLGEGGQVGGGGGWGGVWGGHRMDVNKELKF